MAVELNSFGLVSRAGLGLGFSLGLVLGLGGRVETQEVARGEDPALGVAQRGRSRRMRMASSGALVTRPPTPRSISRTMVPGSLTVQA